MSGIEILLSGSHGIYIPTRFANDFQRWDNIDQDDLDTVKLGPDAEGYWDSWTRILDNATYTDKDGNVWRLWQEGDLFSYCPDLMTRREREEFFGEFIDDEELVEPDDSHADAEVLASAGMGTDEDYGFYGSEED